MQERGQQGMWHHERVARVEQDLEETATRRLHGRHVLEYCLHCAAHVPVLRAWGERWCVDCKRPIVPVAEVLPAFPPQAAARPGA